MNLPEHMKTTAWIESEIRHEERPGIHTYHDCPCGRGKCRTVQCATCWRELLTQTAAAPQLKG